MALLNSNKIVTQANLSNAGYKGWNSNTSYAESYGNKCVTFKLFNAQDHRDLSVPSVANASHYIYTKSIAENTLTGNNFTRKVVIAQLVVEPGCEYSVKITVPSYYYHSASSSSGEFLVSVCIGSKVYNTRIWHQSGSTQSTTITLDFTNVNNECSSTTQTLDIYLQTSRQTTGCQYDSIFFTGSTTITEINIKDARKCIMCQTSPGIAKAQTVYFSTHTGNPCTFSIFRDNITFTILSRIYLKVNYQLTNGGSWGQTQIADLELGDSSSKIYAGNTESKTFYFPVNPVVTGSTGVNECYNSYLTLVTDTTNQNQSITYFINNGNSQKSVNKRSCAYTFSGKYKDTIKTITSFKVRVV